MNMNSNPLHGLRRRAHCVLLVASASVGLCVAHAASPQPPALSEFPLVWSDQVIPNFLITLDDSRSMTWGFLPDTIYADVRKAYYPTGHPSAGQEVLDGNGYETANYTSTLRVHSKSHNALAYDPNVSYLPPRKPDGSRFPNASFTAANIDGFEPFMTAGYKRLNGHHTSVVNLSTSYQMSWYYPAYTTGGRAGQPRFNAFANAPEPAFYATKKAGFVPGVGTCASISNGTAYQALTDAQKTTYDNICFQKVVVSATSGPGSSDERQNFANWYAYSRTRILGAISGLVSAVSSTSADVRMTCQALENTAAAACNTTIPPIETMDPVGRTALVQKLINTPAPGDTALREAAYKAMQYFQGTTATSPWAFNPSAGVKAPEYSCRQSYHMIVTDGEWTGTQASAAPIVDADSSGAIVRPYRDTTNSASEKTLADVAMMAWSTDLRPDLPNNVPKRIAAPNAGNPTAEDNDYRNDPAKHQHLSTFTVGFGVNGALSYPGDTGGLIAGTKQWTPVWKDQWNPSTGVFDRVSNGPGRIDDLWHAAMNGRGMYFSAQNPAALAMSVQNIIDLVTKGTATGSSATGSSSVASTAAKVFITNYTGGSWNGDLKAYPISATGVVGTTASWSAATELNGTAPASRKIYTWEGTNRYEFKHSNMSAALKAQYDLAIGSSVPDGLGVDRVNFIRGVRTGELANGGSFRNRTSVLGDIVNSSATFVGAPIAQYDERVHPGYAAYSSSRASRRQMVYVGANDGMLHGFDASTGKERFAFIPEILHSKTRNLPEVAYAHKSFVDATPIAADVNVGGWKTLLFAPYGTGAKGLFSLNVSSPNSVDADSMAWHLGAATSSQIGYILGSPQRHPITGQPRIVGKIGPSGNWGLFLPNGYNSDYEENGVRGPGDASLVVVDLGTAGDAQVSTWTPGTNVHIIPTTADGAGPYNGLSMPTGVDINGDGYIDVLYAGDLKGNLWKFEMTNTSTVAMAPKALNTVQGKRLFRAVSPTGEPQPITVAPAVIRNGDGKYVVVFGTGRLLTTADKTEPTGGFPYQSLYGIVDDDIATEITRADLFAQKLRNVAGTPNRRFIDPVAGQTGTKRGWRMDLDSSRADDKGERVVTNPILLPGGVVIFATSAPSIDACSQTGTGWTMAMNALTGGALNVATFDLNRNGNVDDDYVMVSGKKAYAAGMQSEVGVSPAPLVLSTGSTIQLITGGASRGWSAAQITLRNQKVDSNGRPLYGRIAWQEIGR
ncbi:MAG: hypothetical protein JNL19_06675 [Burkholderiales bacterium]|nr:hypothetical protein [Burkholderiales bacterium]